VYEALTSEAGSGPEQFILPTTVDRLFVMPANRNLTGAEIELVTIDGRERRLSRLLADLRQTYDHILIDSPPSLGLLTLNALVAADAVLIPLNCEYFALEGIAELLSTIEGVRAALNPALVVDGVVLTMYDDRTNLGQQVSANIREFFGDRVYQTVIPRNIRLGEAPSHGLPVILYDARSRGADAYVALAHEFLARRQPKPAVISVEEDERTAASEPAAGPAASTGVAETSVDEPKRASPAAPSRADGLPELE
jgi:chromosome partitioning protein